MEFTGQWSLVIRFGKLSAAEAESSAMQCDCWEDYGAEDREGCGTGGMGRAAQGKSRSCAERQI
eukprot:scaffold272060_cov28-Tisochrysis_lutea.AAC.3